VIPSFGTNGLLPEGLHSASEAEVLSRFAIGSLERQRLGRTAVRWIGLCRSVDARRFCLNGSFATAEPVPNDVDAVVWLSEDFSHRVSIGNADACELAGILLNNADEHLFAAGNRRDWEDWIRFFSRTRNPAVLKGLVEVDL